MDNLKLMEQYIRDGQPEKLIQNCVSCVGKIDFVEVFENDYHGLVKHFLNNGLTDTHRINFGLRLSSKAGHYKIVRLLIQAGADVHTEHEFALKKASRSGYFKVIHELIKGGADVHAVDDFALRSASIRGHYNATEELLKAGAVIKYHDKSALVIAIKRKGYSEIIDLFDKWLTHSE